MHHVPHYLRDLNPEQQAAALATEGPVLILAGAGSGKTRTLIYRVIHLLERGVDPKRILAVTFTNRAAGEMRERVAKMVGKRARGLTLSTFHSLGARLLREHGERIGLPKGFSIYATGDQLALIRRIILEEVHVVATAGEDTYDAKRVLNRVSGWKNQLVGPEAARREVIEAPTKGNRTDDYEVLAADVYPRYEQALRAAGAVDFDDLLLLPVRLLAEHAEAREACWRRWHYLMIDEFQDTNGAQLELARLLAGPRKNLCVVGDDDQSIYAWRGADLYNILNFEKHYPGAQTIILEQNYRSTQRILDAANAVIANNRARKEKRMRTGNGPGPKLDYWEFDEAEGRTSEEREAEMVAREIGIRRFRENLPWSDFGVLYRTNLQSRPLEEALRNANIPYRVVGGTSYYDRKEVADAVAYFRVAINPNDEISLRRIINYPTRGIGRTTLMRLVESARERAAPLGEVVADPDSVEELATAQTEAVRRFHQIMSRASERLHATEREIRETGGAGATLEQWATALVDELKLLDAIRQENKSDKAAEIRVENLRDFLSAIGTYEQRVWQSVPLPDEEHEWDPPTLKGFLEGVSLLGEDEMKDDDADDGDQRVTLMTLHSAKGLEFTHVFLVGLEEEILPHARTVQEVTDGGADDPLAEERRLFYVGITRARHRLTMSGCVTRRRGGDAVPRQPSRFLKEVPPELMDVHAAAKQSSLDEEESEQMKQNFFAQMKDMLK